MAEKKEVKKEIEKATAVADGVARDHTATPVAPAINGGAPVKKEDEAEVVEAVEAEDKTVIAEDAEDSKEDDKVEEAVESDEGEVVEEADAKAEDDKEEKKSDSATDLLKNVETLLAKLDKGQENAELRKVADSLQKSVGEVVKSVDSLTDRIEALEKQPLPTKAQRFQVVSKGEESEVTDDTAALLKRQEELIVNPGDAKPGEMLDLAMKLRKANIGETIKVN